MKKRSIVIYISFFIVFQISYLLLTNIYIDVDVSMKRFIYTPLFCSLAMIWFSLNLSDNTTEKYLKFISEKPIKLTMVMLYLVTVFFAEMNFLNDFRQSTLYATNEWFFLSIGLLESISYVLFIKIAFRGLILSFQKLQDK